LVCISLPFTRPRTHQKAMLSQAQMGCANNASYTGGWSRSIPWAQEF
jgi:hypothetical protein